MEEDQSGGLEQVGSSGVSEEELMLLKHDAVACINESIFKKLQEIEKVRNCQVFTGSSLTLVASGSGEFIDQGVVLHTIVTISIAKMKNSQFS